MFLQKYTNDFSKMIQQYQLNDEQLRYTGTPEMPIKISLKNPFIHPIIGIANDCLTNFFVLDEKKDVALYTRNEQALLLRTFSTDQRYQGQGYAKKTLQLLPEFVHLHFPNANEIILAVNKQNIAAQSLYEKTGYQRLNRIVDGEYGPLYIMSVRLD